MQPVQRSHCVVVTLCSSFGTQTQIMSVHIADYQTSAYVTARIKNESNE